MWRSLRKVGHTAAKKRPAFAQSQLAQGIAAVRRKLTRSQTTA